MTEAEIAGTVSGVAQAGLEGRTEMAIVEGFCRRAVAGGLPVARAIAIIDTLHPIYQGRAFRWERDNGATLEEYGSSNEGEVAEARVRPTGCGAATIRFVRVTPENIAEFPTLAKLSEGSIVDHVAIINCFAAPGVIGEMDCFYSLWMTDRVPGVTHDEIAALRRLAPFLGLARKSASLARIALTLVETYLGRDAGRRVLTCRIQRGVADRIDTVFWFSDLPDYARVAETSSPDEIIALLDDYADAIVSAIHNHSGDVLKLIGDGVLAIFPAEERSRACAAALDAASQAQAAVRVLNNRRLGEGVPTTEMCLGMHVGEVFYGNIGSMDRLDFTVVGPAVNEVSRIAAMCRSVDQPVLVSAAFVASVADERRRFVSVGRYALRGVGSPQELFTLDNQP